MGGGIFLGGRRLSRARADDGILVKYIFAIKDSKRNKLSGVHSQTEKYEEMISTFHSGKLKYATI